MFGGIELRLCNTTSGGSHSSKGSLAGDNILPILLEKVNDRLGAFRAATIDAEKATRTAQLAALSAIYELHNWFLENHDSKITFYHEHDLKLDPRSKYPALPLVKHFIMTGEPCRELQYKTSYWSGAIQWGIIRRVSPKNFERFIRDTKGGVHGAYRMAVRAASGKQPRGDHVDKFVVAHKEYDVIAEPVPVTPSVHTDGLKPGRYMAVIDIDENGVPHLSARLDNSAESTEKAFQDHVRGWADRGQVYNNRPIKPTARRRYNDSVTRQNPIRLKPDDPALIEGHTRHQFLVRDPSPDEWVLKSGEHSRKLGSIVTKKVWKGFPIYSLSLEERATCPRSCNQWDICYGNGVSQNRAYRYRHGPELIEALGRELKILNHEPATGRGFVVRLHTLGDFYSVEYVQQWAGWIKQYPALRVFGFTAWQPDTEIGAAVMALRDKHWDRFAVRFSNSSDRHRSANVISSGVDHSSVDGIVCPAETGGTECCGTCGLCWTSDRQIVFVEH